MYTQGVKLTNVFQSLSSHKVSYCLLRGNNSSCLNNSVIETDLLIAREHLKQFTTAVREHGFIPMPSWGHAPHHFFITFDKESGKWLKLDAVTDLVYGAPIRYLPIALSEHCLHDRIKFSNFYILSPEHEFITLLLHCMLDKQDFRLEHRQRLIAIMKSSQTDANFNHRIEGYLHRFFPRTLTWQSLSQAINQGDWVRLLKERTNIARHISRLFPMSSAVRYLNNRVGRFLRPLSRILFHRGFCIALLAPDGAGKSTIAEILRDDVILQGRVIYMGTNLNASTVGLPTTAWLQRKKGRSQSTLHRMISSANQMMEQMLRCSVGYYHRGLGHLVVFDRFVYDLLLSDKANGLKQRIKQAVLFKLSPTPDCVILLDAPGRILFERKQEHSPECLEEKRQRYHKLGAKIPNMMVIDATRPLIDIRCDILDRIWRCRSVKS